MQRRVVEHKELQHDWHTRLPRKTIIHQTPNLSHLRQSFHLYRPFETWKLQFAGCWRLRVVQSGDTWEEDAIVEETWIEKELIWVQVRIQFDCHAYRCPEYRLRRNNQSCHRLKDSLKQFKRASHKIWKPWPLRNWENRPWVQQTFLLSNPNSREATD